MWLWPWTWLRPPHHKNMTDTDFRRCDGFELLNRLLIVFATRHLVRIHRIGLQLGYLIRIRSEFQQELDSLTNFTTLPNTCFAQRGALSCGPMGLTPRSRWKVWASAVIMR